MDILPFKKGFYNVTLFICEKKENDCPLNTVDMDTGYVQKP